MVCQGRQKGRSRQPVILIDSHATLCKDSCSLLTSWTHDYHEGAVAVVQLLSLSHCCRSHSVCLQNKSKHIPVCYCVPQDVSVRLPTSIWADGGVSPDWQSQRSRLWCAAMELHNASWELGPECHSRRLTQWGWGKQWCKHKLIQIQERVEISGSKIVSW